MADKSRSTPPTAAQKRLAAERAAAARERIRADQRRHRLVVVAAAVGAVVVLAGVLVAVKLAGGSSGPKSGEKARPAAAVAATLASIPVSAYDAVGLGDAKAAPQPSSGAPLTSGGLPRVLYVGAEWCPYCAAERWAIVAALERFGTFGNLGQTRSSPTDVYANTPTLAFHGATYTSKYLVFNAYELQSNQVSGSSYATLDTISGADRALFSKSGGGYPYVNLGGRYVENSAQYDPAVLGGKSRTQAQVAAAIKDPSTAISKGVLGAANLLTAAVCTLTRNQPAAVCSSSAVRKAAAALPSGS